MTNIFSDKASTYLLNNMCINLEDLNLKILIEAPNFIEFFKNLIDITINLDIPNNYFDINNLDMMYKYDKIINSSLMRLSKQYNIKENSKEYFIFDELRHSFLLFKRSGLIGLWEGREAESWYSKIIIKKVLEPNDIHLLDSKITIFRGTSKEEYESKRFGQPWTLDIIVAEKFAFTHYAGQEDHKDTLRVILKTSINRKYIYYYSKDNNEKEIIIDTQKLNFKTVNIVEEKQID